MNNNTAVEIRFSLHQPLDPRQELNASAPLVSGTLPRVTQVLALALHFKDMIDRGEAKDYADLARLGCVTRERISHIMKLVWLAPEIQQEILYLVPSPMGRYPIPETAIRRIANVLSWADQRRAWLQLKESHSLLHRDMA